MKPDLASLCVRKLDLPAANPSQQLPLFLSSSFAFDTVEESIEVFEGRSSGYVYGRYGNPTIDAVADRIGALEAFDLEGDVQAYLTSSGMSAIHVLLLAVLPHGGKVLTQSNLYGGTTELLLKVMSGLGIEPIFADLGDLTTTEELLRNNPGISAMYLESPSNPTLDCVDIRALSTLAARHGSKVLIDNTFSTPFLQRPLSMGADFVIHSTTKFLNGHGTGIAGAIIGKDLAFMKERVFPVLKLTGATCNPFDAWMVANGLRTLPLRMQRHCENAMDLATWLQGQPKVSKVNYPGLSTHATHAIAKEQMAGFGGMMSFEVAGGRSSALRVMNALRVASIAPTLGDVDTLVLHPCTSSHLRVDPRIREEQGITEGLVRVSVGVEDIGTLRADFEQALQGL